MKVTIGVPVFNVESYIERCANSIFGQTYNNLEIIFVDDCTPDNSISVLVSVLGKFPGRKDQTRIIRHDHNRGIAAARNTVLENASGDFVLWVDSDDYIEKYTVEECVREQRERGDVDIVLFDFCMLRKKGDTIIHQIKCKTVKERTLKLLSRTANVCFWCGFYRLSLYKQNNLSLEEGINNNDDYQITPILSYYSKSFSYINKPLYFYDCTNVSSITHNFTPSKAEQGWRSIEILEDFFYSKDREYLNAIKMVKAERLATYIQQSVEIGNREYYEVLKNKQCEMDHSEIIKVPLFRRIFLLVTNYPILSCYSRIIKIVRRFLRG